MRAGSELRAMAIGGGLFRRLGFRWVFPIGTLPLPYHPLAALLLLIGPPLWIAWLAVAGLGGGQLSWWHPLAVALLLGLPLSVPFVSWALVVFRAPLIQGILIAGSMLLLALDVAAGRVPPAWAVLPSGFVALYLVRRLGGMVQLARLKRQAAAWTPVDPGDAMVVLADAVPDRARDLVTHCNIARASSGKRTAHWLATSDIAALREACEGVPPPGWLLPDPNEPPVVVSPSDAVTDGLILTVRGHRQPLVSGMLHRIEVSAPHLARSVVTGRAQIVGRLPIFTVFRWTAIVGKSSSHFGFAPGKPVELGGDVWAPHRHAFPPRASGSSRQDDPAPLLRRIATDAATERAIIAAFWQAIADDPAARGDSMALRRLSAAPALFRPGDGQRAAAWLAGAKTARAQGNAGTAAWLLTRLPDALFADARLEILTVLNSRILAGEWRIGPDMDLSDVPRDCPRFGWVGGFGLMRSHPKLYDRLAALGEAEARMVAELRASLKR